MTYETAIPGIDLSKVAYIRAIEMTEIDTLPSDALAQISDVAELFVLTNGEGRKLAIIEGRDAAIKAAEMNSLTPMSVH